MDPRPKIATGLLVASALLVAACARLDRQVGQPLPEFRTRLVADRSDYRDVLKLLGPPAKLTRLPNGMAFLYQHVSLTERQIGVSVGDVVDIFGLLFRGERFSSSFGLSWLRLAFAKGSGRNQASVFFFDGDGVLRRISRRTQRIDLGHSFGVLPPIVTVDILDKRNFLNKARHHKWGKALLVPLRKGLNRRQDLDVGMHGFERRGMPRKAGQRTLE